MLAWPFHNACQRQLCTNTIRLHVFCLRHYSDTRGLLASFDSCFFLVSFQLRSSISRNLFRSLLGCCVSPPSLYRFQERVAGTITDMKEKHKILKCLFFYFMLKMMKTTPADVLWLSKCLQLRHCSTGNCCVKVQGPGRKCLSLQFDLNWKEKWIWHE